MCSRAPGFSCDDRTNGRGRWDVITCGSGYNRDYYTRHVYSKSKKGFFQVFLKSLVGSVHLLSLDD